MKVPFAAATLLSFTFQQVEDGETPQRGPRIADFYRTRDGRWFLLHSGFPKNQEATLRLLGCSGDKQDVANAVSGWDGQALEDEMASLGT